MAKNKQSNLIVSVKMLNIGFINKYTTNLGIEGGYLVLVNYQSFLSNLFSLAPPQLFFCTSCKRNTVYYSMLDLLNYTSL